MSVPPGYGETLVSEDEVDALLPGTREVLGDPLTKAAVYDLEQAIQQEVAEDLVTAVLGGGLILGELLTDHFLRELHRGLYGDIWTWAGRQRKREVSIGVAPELIAVQLRSSLETIRHRWEHTDDWTPRILGIAVHAETVRIHPFVDGNGRTTRLLADLVFASAQQSDPPELYDWQVDKRRYIGLLRKYDQHRDPRDLAGFVPVRPLGQ